MTQENLLEKFEQKWFRERFAKPLMHIDDVRELLKEVIGEDEHVYGLAKYKQCPDCGSGEGDLHRMGCMFMFEDFRNKLKAEQRKRAGL